jgi:hypothetical protein
MSVGRIFVDTEVFAALWRQRQMGEESENDILRRIYGLDGRAGQCPCSAGSETARPAANAVVTAPAPSPGGGGERQRPGHAAPTERIVHQEGSTAFQEGFAIFRSLKGRGYHAEVVKGGWRLAGDSRIHASLEALNLAIGAGSENVWMGWSYRNGANKRRPLDEYRLHAR